MADIFIGRQPIFDSNLKVVAYELLYRRGQVSHANVVDGDQATAEVLVNSILEIGLDKIVGRHRVFFNFTRRFLLEKQHIPFPPEQVVIEVLEDIKPEADILDAAREYSTMGYDIALDDYVFTPGMEPWLEVADIVKIDLRGVERSVLESRIPALANSGVKLLAEKVETHEEYQLCKQLGFSYFQGYFLSRPKVIYGHSLPPNRLSILRLMAALMQPDLDMADLERIIEADIVLSVKLLRHINSSFFGLVAPVESVRHAIGLLGIKHVRDWANMLAMISVDDKPLALVTTALVRARMCELLTKEEGIGDPGAAFTAGMFSVLDGLLDITMKEILHTLPISEELREAILYHAGPLGNYLRCCQAYEKGDWDKMGMLTSDSEVITNIYLMSINWADKATAYLS